MGTSKFVHFLPILLPFLLVAGESRIGWYPISFGKVKNKNFQVYPLNPHLLPILLVAGEFQDKNLGQIVVYLWLPEYVKFSNGLLVSSWLCFKWYPISFGKFRTKTGHSSQVQTYLLQGRTYHRSFAKPNIYVNSQSIAAGSFSRGRTSGGFKSDASPRKRLYHFTSSLSISKLWSSLNIWRMCGFKGRLQQERWIDWTAVSF